MNSTSADDIRCVFDDIFAFSHRAICHLRVYEVDTGLVAPAAVIARRHVEDFRAAWERSGLTYDRDVSELIDAAGPGARRLLTRTGRTC